MLVQYICFINFFEQKTKLTIRNVHTAAAEPRKRHTKEIYSQRADF